MAHLSDWHQFNPTDRATYPKVQSPIQVMFIDGRVEDGDTRMFFPHTKLLPVSSISAWRYIKGVAQR